MFFMGPNENAKPKASPPAMQVPSENGHENKSYVPDNFNMQAMNGNGEQNQHYRPQPQHY